MMLGDALPMRRRHFAATAALFALAFCAQGCSSAGNLFGGPTAATPAATPAAATPPPSGGSWLSGDIANFFSRSSDRAPQTVAGAPSPDMECPYIQIREGASTLTISTGGDNAAMSLKYQGTFVRAARQCAVVAGQMVMKVGVEGRIILGPQGGPGQVIVPLRIAVVDERPSSSKTIVTKLIPIPVMVRSADDNPIFTHVEDNIAFPVPSSSELENYIVYIGFDALAAEAQQKHERPKPRTKRKPKPEAAPATD